MGTRGLFGVVIDGQLKASYNQFDSYPSGKGIDNLRWLRENTQDGWQHLIDQARALKLVDEDGEPTPEDIEVLRPFTNLDVSSRSTHDFYCLTRETHGYIGKILECGYCLDSTGFARDSLMCEWAYLVDLDASTFEVYKGFRESVPTEGRWAGDQTKVCEGYYPIQRVKVFALKELPTDEEFLASFEE